MFRRGALGDDKKELLLPCGLWDRVGSPKAVGLRLALI
jgi:hypothetical protein